MTTEGQPQPDLRAERDEARAGFEPVAKEPPQKGRGGFKLFLVLVVLTIAGGAGAYFYLGDKMSNSGTTAADRVPVIRADENPIKERPADPGGMQIPDRDKLVYNRLKGEDAPKTVERILPDPEEPKTPPQPEIGPDAVSPDAADSGSVMPQPVSPDDIAKEAPIVRGPVTPPEQPAPDAQPIAPVTAEAVPSPVSPPAPPEDILADKIEEALADIIIEEPSAPKPADVAAIQPPPAAPAPKTPATEVRGGDYRIQLTAARSEERAQAAWAGFVKKYGDILGGLKPFIMRADLGDKGVFYRLRAGPFADQASAQAACASLKARKVDCLVKKAGS